MRYQGPVCDRLLAGIAGSDPCRGGGHSCVSRVSVVEVQAFATRPSLFERSRTECVCVCVSHGV